jgi:hypothetical protein
MLNKFNLLTATDTDWERPQPGSRWWWFALCAVLSWPASWVFIAGLMAGYWLRDLNPQSLSYIGLSVLLIPRILIYLVRKRFSTPNLETLMRNAPPDAPKQ